MLACLRANAAREEQRLVPSSCFLLQPLPCQPPGHGMRTLRMSPARGHGAVALALPPPTPEAPHWCGSVANTRPSAHLRLSSGVTTSCTEMQDPTHGSTPHAWLYTPHGSNPIQYGS